MRGISCENWKTLCRTEMVRWGERPSCDLELGAEVRLLAVGNLVG
ncbi:hypothetical protein YSA_09025 [Pseudomonas putida ND6]|uniref:Uncharacterized protein n=1 Tax=Pseudomonas putida ND6 TaxID=231023 RepID=I3V1M6_PSEPU|nr:hypothetical protein YSA_09025 [Pseudomonas putida ND6]